MKTQQLMTGAAVGFAVFAAWFVLRGPGRSVIAPTADQKRANEVGAFLGTWNLQGDTITNQAPGFYVPPLTLN